MRLQSERPQLHYFLLVQRLNTKLVKKLFYSLDADDSPPVISFTLFNKKGVIFAPEIFYSSASLRACLMPVFILSESASLSAGIGTVNKIPVSRRRAS